MRQLLYSRVVFLHAILSLHSIRVFNYSVNLLNHTFYKKLEIIGFFFQVKI